MDNALMPDRVTIKSWMERSGFTRTATYEALAAGHLQAVKAGRRVLIDFPAALAWLASLPAPSIRPTTTRKPK